MDKCSKIRQATYDYNTAHVHSMLDKATDRHSEYAIIIALPRRQWLRERVSMSRYMYIAFLVVSY